MDRSTDRPAADPRGSGIDTTNVINIVGGAITAGSGNGYDGVLDKREDGVWTPPVSRSRT
jgi:hypothetical protein